MEFSDQHLHLHVYPAECSCVFDQVIMKEMKGGKDEDKTPPAWFTSYMEKVRISRYSWHETPASR